MQEKGLLNEEDTHVFPDIYARNQHLDDEVKNLRREVNKLRDAALYVFFYIIVVLLCYHQSC